MAEDLGSFRPFPQARPKQAFFASQIAVQVNGKHHVTREGLETVAEALGFRASYDPVASDDEIVMDCTLYAGEDLLGVHRATMRKDVKDAVRAAQSQALVGALERYAPDVLAEVRRILGAA